LILRICAHLRIDYGFQLVIRNGDYSRVTGNPEVIGSSVGSVPTNGLVTSNRASSRMVGNPSPGQGEESEDGTGLNPARRKASTLSRQSSVGRHQNARNPGLQKSDAHASTSGLARIVTLFSVTPVGVIWQAKKSRMEKCKSFCKSPHKNDSKLPATTR
jgi:hypothetical protein